MELKGLSCHAPHDCLQRGGASVECLLCASSQPNRTKQIGSQRVAVQTEHRLGRPSGKATWRRWHEVYTDCANQECASGLGTLRVYVWHNKYVHLGRARVMTETLGVRALPGAGGWPGGQVMAEWSLAVPARLLLEVLPGCGWVLGSSKVRMGVNPRGILEDVGSRPTGRAWLLAGSCQGRKRLWNSWLWEKGRPCGRAFSAGAFQAGSALVPSRLLREMGAEKGPHPSRLPFSWRAGQAVGGGCGRMWG